MADPAQPQVANMANDFLKGPRDSSVSMGDDATIITPAAFPSTAPPSSENVASAALPTAAPLTLEAKEHEAGSSIAQQQVGESATNRMQPQQVLSQPAGGDSDPAKCEEDAGITMDITLLLTSGTRHPFRIDSRWLRKQGVNVKGYDPFNMSTSTLKDLIWRQWRSDWEPRPQSPSHIRLISFGKMLEDGRPLSESKFNREAPTVVHMTVRPQSFIEDNARAVKGDVSQQEQDDRTPGCRCVIL